MLKIAIVIGMCTALALFLTWFFWSIQKEMENDKDETIDLRNNKEDK